VASVPAEGLLDNQPPRIPHELPVFPVVEGAFHPVGNVVVFAMPEALPLTAVCDAVAVTSGETALKGPLLVDVLAAWFSNVQVAIAVLVVQEVGGGG